MKQAPQSLQRRARSAGFLPVPVSLTRKPGRPQGAQDRQQRARLTAQASWEAAMELMRERYDGLTMAGQERRVASFENRELADKVLKNERERNQASIRTAGLRRYRKGPKPAALLVRRRKDA